jgi:hypothetical protein
VWKLGKHFNKWAEWRAMVIKEFAVKARKVIKMQILKSLSVTIPADGTLTYFHVGVNWPVKNMILQKSSTGQLPNIRRAVMPSFSISI